MTATVSDDDVTSVRTATVTVVAPGRAILDAIAAVEALSAAGKLGLPTGNSLTVKLEGAIASMGSGNLAAAHGKLHAAVNQLEALVQARRLSPGDATPIRGLLERAMRSLSAS